MSESAGRKDRETKAVNNIEADKMLHHLTVIFADILQIITDKYVKNDLAIPEDVLKLKDEACNIIGKAADIQQSRVLAEYGQRLIGIREVLLPR